jgi:SAM-dependent methyltransferase
VLSHNLATLQRLFGYSRPVSRSLDHESLEAADREKSFGEDYQLTFMDRFGTWLSAVAIRRALGPLEGRNVADFGCGYDARFMRTLLGTIESATLVDVKLADDLKARPDVHAIEGVIPDALAGIPDDSLDAIVCNNVLEHLVDPVRAVREIRRTLRPGARCFVNVPSWRGKVVLETAAFRLGITSAPEIDDHKAYYTPRELWMLLVKGGFKPSGVKTRSHKLGLNTFGVCVKKA